MTFLTQRRRGTEKHNNTAFLCVSVSLRQRGCPGSREVL
jgi:hypothetical protein